MILPLRFSCALLFVLMTLVSMSSRGQSIDGDLSALDYNGGCFIDCNFQPVETLNQYYELPTDWHTPPINWKGESATAYAFGNDIRQAYVGVVSGQFIKPEQAPYGVFGRSILNWRSPVYLFGGASGNPTTFTITPSYLEIWGFAHARAEMKIVIYLCQGQLLTQCTVQARVSVGINGAGGTVSTNTFELAWEETPAFVDGTYVETVQDCSECTDADGNPRPYSDWTTIAAIYDFPGYTGEIDFFRPLPMAIGAPFQVLYDLEVVGASERGSESYGEGFIGDPLDANSGVLLDIGSAHTLADPQPLVSSQICNEGLDRTAPDDRFVVLDNATVNDTRTNLNWPRCPQGYLLEDNATTDFTDDSCTAVETTEFTWQAALEEAGIANDAEVSGNDDWRLPNIKELHSIVEFACNFPAINSQVFPAFATDQTWSSTANDVGTAEYLAFNSGVLRTASQPTPYSVRLVRPATFIPPPTVDNVFANGFE